MLAGMFAKPGYFFGNNLYAPRDSNPKGFYEDEEINSLNEDIILDAIRNAEAEGSVDRPSECYRTGQLWLARFPVDLKFAANEEQRVKINKVTSQRPFCFKDPRFCFTLDSWLQIASNCVVLCTFRHPASTVASILRECHRTPYLFNFPISVEYAFTIWREMYWRFLRLYKNHKNIYFVHYEDVLSGIMIGKLEDLVESELDRRFPEASLNRSVAELPVDDKSKRIFDALLDISKDDLGRVRNSKRRKVIRHVEDKLVGSSLYCLPRAKDQWVESIHKTITDQDCRFERVSSELAELQKTISGNLGHIKSAYETLAERDAQVKTAAEELERLRAELAHREAKTQSLGRTVREQNERIASLSREIHTIYASKSWRLTAPLRWVRRALGRAASLFFKLGGAMMPGGRIERVEILRAIFRRLPLSEAIKCRLRGFVFQRFPAVRDTVRDLGTRSKSLALQMEDESKYSYARLPHPGATWILVAELRIPTPDRTSASTRLFGILRLLTEMGFKISFLSHTPKSQYHWVLDSEAQIKPYEAELTRMGITVFYGFDQATNHLVKEGYKYRYAFLSYPDICYQYLPLVRAYAINAIVVYDTVDLHGLRLGREAEVKQDPALREQANRYNRVERLNIECSDLIIAITEDERQEIRSVSREAKVAIISNIHECNAPVTSLAERKDLMFIGHFLHSPNEDAVKYFVKEILPLIRPVLPDAIFWILGSSMTEGIKQLASDCVKAIGYVQDSAAYFYSRRIFVAPLRYGAGMKGKIGQSMSLGLPVVTTSIGAEGMRLTHGKNVLIADTPEKFSDAVVGLYTDDALWMTISEGGLRHIDEKFSYKAVRKDLETIFGGAVVGRGHDQLENQSTLRQSAIGS